MRICSCKKPHAKYAHEKNGHTQKVCPCDNYTHEKNMPVQKLDIREKYAHQKLDILEKYADAKIHAKNTHRKSKAKGMPILISQKFIFKI